MAGHVTPAHLLDRHDPDRKIPFLEKWSPLVQFKLAVYFACCAIALMKLPNTIWNQDLGEITYVRPSTGDLASPTSAV